MGFKSFSSIMMQLFSQEEKYTVTSALKILAKIEFLVNMEYKIEIKQKLPHKWKTRAKCCNKNHSNNFSFFT